MVEEIAGRYVAALPKPIPKKQKLALRLCAFMALLGLVLLLAGQARHLQRLDDNYGNLRYSIENVNWNVNRQIDGITNRVQSALEERARVMADYGAEPSDPPPDRGPVAGQQCWRFDHFWLDALAAAEGDYAFAARVTDEYGRVSMVEAPFYIEHNNAFHFAVDRSDASVADPDNWDFTPSA